MKVLKLLFVMLLFAACSPDNNEDSLSNEMNVETKVDQDLKRMLETHLGESDSTVLYAKSAGSSVIVGAVASCATSTGDNARRSEYVDYVYISQIKPYNRTVDYAIFKDGTPMYYDSVIVPANQGISNPLAFNRGIPLQSTVGLVTTKIFDIKNTATGVSETGGITLYEPSFFVDNCFIDTTDNTDGNGAITDWDCDGDGIANLFDSTPGDCNDNRPVFGL